MKIAVVCPDDLSIVLFCKGLVYALKDGHNNEVYVLCDNLAEEMGKDYTKVITTWGVIHIPVSFYRFINPFRDLKYILTLFRIFRRERFDMVINITTKPNIYGTIAAWLAGVDNKICAVWGLGVAFSERKNIRYRFLRACTFFLYRLAFFLCNKIWFTNPNDAEVFYESTVTLPHKVILTKNYVNTQDYSPSAVDGKTLTNLRSEFGLQHKDKMVVMVGRLSWAKGVREFVEAAGLLRERFPHAKFILVGPKDEGSPDSVPESFLLERQEENINFRWVGFRNDVKEIYAISNVAVLPTYYREGGYPRGLTEPMAM